MIKKLAHRSISAVKLINFAVETHKPFLMLYEG
jgi:hypothetical protein